MIKNVNFSPVSQNNNLNLKLNPTRQHESRDMLGLQSRALDAKILKFYPNRDNSVYLKKYDFQWKLVC